MANVPRHSPHAPGQYYGYSLQATRLLARLLTAEPGSFVSIEVFEDVGIETSTGDRIVEQDKSTLEGNPIADRSPDLWKTFSNWLDAVEANELDPDRTLFEIYVSRPRNGSIVESFSKAQTLDEASQALLNARNELWGAAPSYSKKADVAAGLVPYLKNVFEYDKQKVGKVLCAFSLQCGSGSPHADLKAQLRKCMVSEDFLEESLNYALGWVKRETDVLLEQGKPAVVEVDRFRNTFTSFLRAYDRRTILASFAGEPASDAVEAHLRYRTYVRQLELISCNADDLELAVIDFCKAAVDRTVWSAKGWVDEASFDNFEDGLVRTWRNLKLKSSAAFGHLDGCAQGKCLYADCANHTARINGIDVPFHFTSGSFHALADKPVIGWHPEYQSKLRKGRKDEE